jgi:hypothetical protein
LWKTKAVPFRQKKGRRNLIPACRTRILLPFSYEYELWRLVGVVLRIGTMHEMIRRPGPGELHPAFFQLQRR